MLFLYTETPVHPGSGLGTGYIDLPIQRESFTDFPIIRASSLKGSLRDYFESFPDSKDSDYNNKVLESFGPAPGPGASDFAGALGVGEAKLLFLPISSLYGVFAYLTCPLILQRLKRDLALISSNQSEEFSEVNNDELADDSIYVISDSEEDGRKTAIARGDKAVFHEFAFTAQKQDSARSIADLLSKLIFPDKPEYEEWKKQFHSRFAIVSDNVFKDFSGMATEVITRNKIDDDTGVVSEIGGLWTEELLPSETVFYSVFLAAKPFRANPILKDASEVIEFIKGQLNDKRVQIGGDRSVGRGIMVAHFLPQEVKNG